MASAQRNFQAPCCRQYFAYTCPATASDRGAWKHMYCPGGQVFNPTTGQCGANVNNIDCSACGTAPDPSSDRE